MLRRLFALPLMLSATLLPACDFGSYTFKEDLAKASAKAKAWNSDAQLGAAQGNGIGSDGKSQQPSGAWGYVFFSAKASKAAKIQVFDGAVTLTEFPVGGADLALDTSEANSFSAWPVDTDSPKWYADAKWPTPHDVADSNINQLRIKVFHCDAGPCPFEDNAVIATEEHSSNQLELFPTYRVVGPADAGH